MSGLRLTIPTAGTLVRLGAIGAILLGVASLFAYVGGWLSPGRLTQARMMMAFEETYGSHPGFRRNHAKGICVSGWFEGSGQIRRLSKAAVFRPDRVPVIGRFALAGGMPFQADMPTRSAAWRCVS
jgi:catalase